MIDQLTNQEKSVLLLKAMGATKMQAFGSLGGKLFHFISWIDAKEEIIKTDIKTEETSTPEVHYAPDLYDPANMALAKKAIEWGAENVPKFTYNTLSLIAYAAWTKPDGVRTLLDELVLVVSPVDLEGEQDES